MDLLIILALIAFLVLGIIFTIKYCDTPNGFDPNTFWGRVENRYKREIEQDLYKNIIMPVLSALPFIILGIIGLIIFAILSVLGVK